MNNGKMNHGLMVMKIQPLFVLMFEKNHEKKNPVRLFGSRYTIL